MRCQVQAAARASPGPAARDSRRPTAAVLLGAQSPAKAGAAAEAGPAPQRSLSAALFSVFKGPQRTNELDQRAVAALEAATNARAEQADAIEERALAAKEAAPLPDISAFLRPAGVLEARYVRLLSSLSALTYHLDRLTPSSLMRRHHLRLVSTSRVCELKLREPRASPADVAVLADAMAGDPAVVAAAQAAIAAGEARGAGSATMRAVARVAPLPSLASAGGSLASLGSVDAPAEDEVTEDAGAGPGEAAPTTALAPPLSGPAAPPAASTVDRVATSLASAAAAASAAAQGVYSAAVPYAGPLANNITTFTASVAGALPVQSVAAQLQSAAAVGHSSAIATVATVSAALESSWAGRAGRLPKECQSPTEWFIADDPGAHTRYFVLQGSDNLDHWRVNLTFDPVPFEDAALGVRVHRGVYEAAAVLYDRFLPLVQDHLASSPFAKVAFTGHSLGGSLGTALMLMYVRRGVLPRSAVSPVYTFGAPAVFCEAGAGCPCGPPGEGGAPGGLLRALGLPEGAVRNVLMHRDIVPRAFACDYALVADLLKRVSESFRDHGCLNARRTVMFDFVGKVLVLQPPPDAAYVGGEGEHMLLPPGPGLYVLRQPPPLGSVAATLRRDATYVSTAVQHALTGLPPPAAEQPAPAARRVPPNAREAVWELMNSPHPLDILADPGAYGPAGAISRYHNPDNYSRALRGVLHARGAALRRLLGRARDSGLRHFAPPLDPAAARAGGEPPAVAPASPERRGGKQLLRLVPRGGSSGDLRGDGGSPQPA